MPNSLLNIAFGPRFFKLIQRTDSRFLLPDTWDAYPKRLIITGSYSSILYFFPLLVRIERIQADDCRAGVFTPWHSRIRGYSVTWRLLDHQASFTLEKQRKWRERISKREDMVIGGNERRNILIDRGGRQYKKMVRPQRGSPIFNFCSKNHVSRCHFATLMKNDAVLYRLQYCL